MSEKISENKKLEIISHINGEILMLEWCHVRLSKDILSLSGEEKRMALECFLLHARNLADFLWIKEGYPGDALATDYSVNMGELNEDFKKIRTRINKQLSHITYDRLTDEQMNLLVKEKNIYKEIKDGLRKFNDNVPIKYKLQVSPISI